VNEFTSKKDEPLPDTISNDNCCVLSESYATRGAPKACGPTTFSETFLEKDGSKTGGSLTSIRLIVTFANVDEPKRFMAFTRRT